VALVPGLGWRYLALLVLANLAWFVLGVLITNPYARSIEYEFGEKDLLVRRGLLTHSESTVPYRMVTNVEVKRGPIARALGIGTLKVHTAGFSQDSMAEATLSGLTNWEEVRQRLLEEIHAGSSAEQAGPAGAVETPLSGGENTELLAGILAEVRAWRAERPR